MKVLKRLVTRNYKDYLFIPIICSLATITVDFFSGDLLSAAAYFQDFIRFSLVYYGVVLIIHLFARLIKRNKKKA